MPPTADLLRRHRLRSTPVRRAVVDCLRDSTAARTLAELDAAADGDRVTLYRTLKSFEEVGLIHRVADASGQVHYALCGEACGPEAHAHEHAHFRCNSCSQTYCLPEARTPAPVLPKGYRVQEVHVTYQGTCQQCNAPTNL